MLRFHSPQLFDPHLKINLLHDHYNKIDDSEHVTKQWSPPNSSELSSQEIPLQYGQLLYQTTKKLSSSVQPVITIIKWPRVTQRNPSY